MSHYARESDIALLTLGSSRKSRARETPWGLLEFDSMTGELISLEFWEASQRLPAELLEALPEPSGHEVVIERQPA